MQNFTAAPNISGFLDKTIAEYTEYWKQMLKEGDLYGFEKSLSTELLNVYESIASAFMQEVASEIFEKLASEAKKAGAKKIEARSMRIRLGTGSEISIKSPYVKEYKGQWEGSRHLLGVYWGTIGSATPSLYEKVGYCTAIGPSYNIANQTLARFGTMISLSSTQDISNRIAERCAEYGEENLMLKEGESLENKRVVISIDGGRTRTRVYNGEANELGNLTYDTGWREPKLFVIDVIDNKGNLEKHRLPIYGVRFGEDDVISLLESYLRKLKIEKAAEVQILGDGAPWIWNQLPPMIERLNVDKTKLTETLDYYHSSSYVYELVDCMPEKLTEEEKKKYLETFKGWLWNGEADKIVAACRQIFKHPSKEVNRRINYLTKHQTRMQYAAYSNQKLMCGSGIVESAIRRIINLRFKNTSTFWKENHVEKLFFLRAAVLSGRWDNVIQRLSNAA
jgi:hypothetical protein